MEVKVDQREPKKTVQKARWWQYVLLLIPSLVVRLWARTLKVTLSLEVQEAIKKHKGPRLIVFWHNTLFIAAELDRRFGRGKKVFGLVSASKDGAWLDACFKLMGVGTARGSSSFRGSQALKELIQKASEDHDITITPDGPRGPMYSIKPGVGLLAKKLKMPLILLAPEFDASWRLNSWDRFHIPKPFSRIYLRGLFFENAEEFAKEGSVSEAEIAERIRTQLLSITKEK